MFAKIMNKFIALFLKSGRTSRMNAANSEIIDILSKLKESRELVEVRFPNDETYKSHITGLNWEHDVLLIDTLQPVAPAKSITRGTTVRISTHGGGRKIDFMTRYREPLLFNQNVVKK